jgi:fumarate reductase subunit D
MSNSFFDSEKNEEFSGDSGIPELNNENSGSRPAEDRRMMAIMAYIPFLCFLPLIKMKDDQYAYFHARQGLILFFIEIIAFIFSFPHISQLFWVAIIIACIGSAVAGIMFALQGKAHRLPIISDLADKIKI